jgi:hypothetical protein
MSRVTASCITLAQSAPSRQDWGVPGVLEKEIGFHYEKTENKK